MAGGMSQTLKAILGLREMISRGDVQPGERMSELVLVERLGLSRTPIRAALARLAQEGLLEEIPTGGYAARAFSDEDVADAIELRGTIEGLAARLAAERGLSEAALEAVRAILAGIDALMARPAERFRFADYVELNGQFHDALAELPGSDLIRRELARVKSLPFASPVAFLEVQAQLPSFREVLVVAHSQHHALVEAIAAREGARAEAIAREHARQARRNYLKVKGDWALKARVPGLSLVTG